MAHVEDSAPVLSAGVPTVARSVLRNNKQKNNISDHSVKMMTKLCHSIFLKMKTFLIFNLLNSKNKNKILKKVGDFYPPNCKKLLYLYVLHVWPWLDLNIVSRKTVCGMLWYPSTTTVPHRIKVYF